MDEVDRLLADCLERPDAEWAAAVEAQCAAHPGHAAELRRRFAAIHSVGVLAHDDAVPARLDRYRLLRRLGSGGMGVVYLAEDESLGRQVALKVVRPELLYFPQSRLRFRREVETVARLRHPGIVPVLAVGEADGVPFFAMELVEGCSLAEIVRALGHRVPADLTGADLAAALAQATGTAVGRADVFPARFEDACLQIALQVADALAHAHAKGVVHRDVKPSNVMLTADARALLLDFGVARDAGSQLTRSGSLLGSLAYMAPEQLAGGAVDARADVFALAVTLYELLSLCPAFAGATSAEIERRIRGGDAAPLRQLNPALRWETEVICRKAMDPEPARRYASAAALVDDLRRALARQPILARAPSPLLRTRRWTQRHPALAVGLVLGFLAFTVLPLALLAYERQASAAIAREAETARRTLRALQDMLGGLDPFQGGDPDLPARKLLELAERNLAHLDDQPHLRGRLARVLGACYRNLGLHDRAEPLLRGALAALRQQAEPLEAADAANSLALLLDWTERTAEAEGLYRDALATLGTVLRPDAPELASVLVNLGVLLVRTEREAEGETLLRRAVALRRADAAPAPIDLAIALRALGHALLTQERHDEAAGVLGDVLAVLGRTPRAPNWLDVTATVDLAACATAIGRDDCVALARRGVDLAEQVFGPGKRSWLHAVRELWRALRKMRQEDAARALLAEKVAAVSATHPAGAAQLRLWAGDRTLLDGDPAGAAADLQAALELERRAHPEGSPAQVEYAGKLAYAQTLLGRAADAEATLRAAVALAERIDAPPGVRAEAGAALAIRVAERGQHEAAKSLADEAAAALAGAAPADPACRGHVHDLLAYAYLLCGNAADAQRYAEAAVAALRARRATPPADLALAMAHAGWARSLQQDAAGAEAWYRQAVQYFAAGAPYRLRESSYTLQALAGLLVQKGELGEAVTLLRRALAARQESGAGAALRADTTLALARTLERAGEPAEALAVARQGVAVLREAGLGEHRLAKSLAELVTRLEGAATATGR